ncbi:hypothetical protein N182_21010 [Sinorhizobium sp. GL2]|nr:hypothetical protein N182_21010 [Sinorhizobium sp. GL2]
MRFSGLAKESIYVCDQNASMSNERVHGNIL